MEQIELHEVIPVARRRGLLRAGGQPVVATAAPARDAPGGRVLGSARELLS
jgi:hypothetical protein